MIVKGLMLVLAFTLLLNGVVQGQSFMNERCTNSTECVPKNSACIKQTCLCKDGFYLMGYTVCRPVSNFQESCMYNQDCKHGVNLECSSFQGNVKFCSCKSGSIWNGTACAKVPPETLLRSSCETNADCAPELRMICRRPSVEPGACSCEEHWKWNGTICNCNGKMDAGGICVSGITVEDGVWTGVATAIGILLVCCCCCCFAVNKCYRKFQKKKKQAAERMVAMSALQEQEDGYRVQSDGFQVQYQPVPASGGGPVPPPPVAGQPYTASDPTAGGAQYPPPYSPYPAAGAPGYPPVGDPNMPYPHDPTQGPNATPYPPAAYPPQPVPYQDPSAPPPTM